MVRMNILPKYWKRGKFCGNREELIKLRKFKCKGGKLIYDKIFTYK